MSVLITKNDVFFEVSDENLEIYLKGGWNKVTEKQAEKAGVELPSDDKPQV